MSNSTHRVVHLPGQPREVVPRPQRLAARGPRRRWRRRRLLARRRRPLRSAQIDDRRGFGGGVQPLEEAFLQAAAGALGHAARRDLALARDVRRQQRRGVAFGIRRALRRALGDAVGQARRAARVEVVAAAVAGVVHRVL